MEPGDLVGGHGVVEVDGLFCGAVGVVDGALDGLVGGEVGEAGQADAVVLANEVVVGGVLEGEGEEALLFEVGLVDAGEAAGYDGSASEEPVVTGRRARGCCPRRSCRRRSRPSAGLSPCSVRRYGEKARPVSPVMYVLPLPCLAGEGVGGTHEHVLAELGEVAAVFEPGPGG